MKDKKAISVVLGLMCLALTAGIFIQIRTVESSNYAVSQNYQENNLRSEVLKYKERYDNRYREFERAQKELEEERKTSTQNDSELEKKEEEIKSANKIIGLAEVTGPGVIITLSDSKKDASSVLDPSSLLVHDADVLCIINELKNAGAEAIDVNGQRIINTTEISCDGNVIVVNGVKIGTPFTISAIGLQARFNTLKRPGGYLEKMEDAYIKVDFELSDNITIPKYNGVNKTFKYAKTVK